MRRAIVAVVLSLIASSGAALAGTPGGGIGASAAAAAPRPPVKQVFRAYGDGPVRLAYRQEGAITFRASRGDEVTVTTRAQGSWCSGRLTLTDRRGSRTQKQTYKSHVFRVRTAGRATIRFQGDSACGTADRPLRVQLVKLRGQQVPVDGEPVVLEKPERGFLDVAWIRVPRTGRLKLTGRDAGGHEISAARMLVGNELANFHHGGLSVERGLPRLATWDTYFEPDDPALRRGTRVGLTFGSDARVEASSALPHAIELDGPPVTLASGSGREHVLTVKLPRGARTYLDSDEEWWEYGANYWLPPAPGDPAKAGTYRLVVASDGDAPYQERTLRLRSYRTATLVVGGPPLRLESADPGERFWVRVVASKPGRVRLAASDVTVTGGDWAVRLANTCSRDCYGGATVNQSVPVATGSVPKPKSGLVLVDLGSGATGGLTLTLKPEQG
ncbi:hypothetical protein [Nocardioides sp. 616]|uniref:hypothetical protein n=1 Tax=Nocardioides sp. 616 TaxID=2268090 RepID=UPI0013B43CEC|nr:hypothetical protein [Nocardioides sp. 616]